MRMPELPQITESAFTYLDMAEVLMADTTAGGAMSSVYEQRRTNSYYHVSSSRHLSSGLIASLPLSTSRHLSMSETSLGIKVYRDFEGYDGFGGKGRLPKTISAAFKG